MLSKYENYASLAHRPRRSLLPVVGNALGYLFGIPSEEDLCVIERALGKLANTQGRIVHKIENSISIINVTRSEATDNRHKINALNN